MVRVEFGSDGLWDLCGRLECVGGGECLDKLSKAEMVWFGEVKCWRRSVLHLCKGD